MNSNAAQNYLRMRVMTATPEQLQMMLYDGAIRFSEQARIAMEARQFDQSYATLVKVQKIVVELVGSLKHDQDAVLCGKLASLYNYIYRKLVDANTHRDLGALDEAIELLKFQRETWGLLLDKLGKSKAASAASQLSIPGPSQQMEACLSTTG